MTTQKAPPRKETPQELLERITAFLAATREHVAGGGDADLEGLDAKVQELCDAVLDMPRTEAVIFQEKLEEVAGQLVELKASLEQVQAEVRQQISALNLRHKAVKAYKNTEVAETPVSPAKPDPQGE